MLAESAARLCDADHVWLFRRDGEVYRWATSYGHSKQEHERIKQFMLVRELPPGRESLVGRTALEGRTVQIVDVFADPEYTQTEPRRLACRCWTGRGALRENRARQHLPAGPRRSEVPVAAECRTTRAVAPRGQSCGRVTQFWQRRTNVWRKVAKPARAAKRLRSGIGPSKCEVAHTSPQMGSCRSTGHGRRPRERRWQTTSVGVTAMESKARGARGTIPIQVVVPAFRLARPDPRFVTTSTGRSR